jgi:hypothetical protein
MPYICRNHSPQAGLNGPEPGPCTPNGPETPVFRALSELGRQAIDQARLDQPLGPAKPGRVELSVAPAGGDTGKDITPAEIVHHGSGDGRAAKEPENGAIGPGIGKHQVFDRGGAFEAKPGHQRRPEQRQIHPK